MTRVKIGVVVRKKHGTPTFEALQGRAQSVSQVAEVNRLADPSEHRKFVNKVFALVRT